MYFCRWIACLVLFATILFASALRISVALEPTHHNLRLQVDPNNATITVRDRITVSGGGNITLTIADWMRVSEIRLNKTAIQHDMPGPSRSLTLPSRGKHQIEVSAEGAIPMRHSDKARQRSALGAVASSDGVYLPNWVGWFPQVSGRPATYLLSIVTPEAYRSAATGALKSEHLSANQNISVFELRTMMGAPSVFVGPYVVAERRSSDIRIRTYFHPSTAGLAEEYLDAAERYIEMFEQGIGPYPFADFHIVSAPLPVGLGFPNLTYVDRRILRLPFMRGRSLAHEVLHNWWGNGVRVNYKTGNWSEGLTTYMADHALAEHRDQHRAREMRLGWLRDFAALPADRNIPVNRFVSKQHDAAQVVGYGKVAFIFHMLKHEVGPDQFTTSIKRFWRDHKHEIAGWQDIKATFQATHQRDLSWFFRQWVERAGAPRLKLGNVRTSRQAGGYVLEITLAQEVPAYRLKVPVQVRTETDTKNFEVHLGAENVTTQLRLDAKPISLKIDPGYTLFRQLYLGEAPPILRDVLLDRSAKTLVLWDDLLSQELARALANRLFNVRPLRLITDSGDDVRDTPLLVVGSRKLISRFIASSQLAAPPAEIADRGTARVWTTRNSVGKAILFVEVDDLEALRVMMRPLPHYRSKSYIVFEGHRAVDYGVWPSSDRPLAKKLH